MAESPISGPPEGENASQPRSTRRRRLKQGTWIIVGLGLGAVVTAATALDAVVSRLYRNARPGLEQHLGSLLGHSLQLGDYRGLGWSGLELGQSWVLPLSSDPSSLRVRQIGLSLDPVSSLRRRLLVLQVTLDGVELDLRRNAQGGYWQFGNPRLDGEPPRMDLRVRFAQPARIRLAPSGQELALQLKTDVQPHRQTFSSVARLGARGAGPAPVLLKAGGNWAEGRYQAQLLSRRLKLAIPAAVAGLPGAVAGELDGRLKLIWQEGAPDCNGALKVNRLAWKGEQEQARLAVPQLTLRCAGTAFTLPETRWRYGAQKGQLAFNAGWNDGGLDLKALNLRAGRSWLRSQGRLGDALALKGQWQLEPSDLPLPPGVPTDLLGGPVRGDLALRGSWSQPLLRTTLSQGSSPLLERWQARLRWQNQALELESLESPYLNANGMLRSNGLQLALQLRAYPLERLSPVLGTPLQGVLEGNGTIRGPLSGLTPTFQLRLAKPAVGPLWLAETWQGDWIGDPAGGGRLRMQPSAGNGLLEARLDRRWVPVAASLQRHGGALRLTGTPQRYRWTATNFPLAGLQLALGPSGRFQPLQGGLSGEGLLELQPLAFQGRVALERPSVLGVLARRVLLEGSYGDRSYQAKGQVLPMAGGDLALNWRGRWRDGFRAELQGRDLEDALVRQLLAAWPRWKGVEVADPGRAADLGTLLIDTFGGSLDQQLIALNRAHAQRQQFDQDQLDNLTAEERLEQVAARFDLDALLRGPSLAKTHLDLKLQGHLWLPGQDRDQPLSSEPLAVTLQGPVQLGQGSFSLNGLPLALLALLTPVPAELRGVASLQGRYRLGSQPELTLDLALEDAGLGETPMALERGSVQLVEERLELDLALRAAGASSGIDLAGSIPLDADSEALELRLSSRDDGLIFISQLAQPAILWQQGQADLQLLVRGSLREPIANGFLRLDNSALEVIGQPVEDLQATVLFDFERLVLQQFSARVGEKGSLTGSGSLGLLRPQSREQGDPQSDPLGEAGSDGVGAPAQLRFQFQDLPFQYPRITAQGTGELVVDGSLTALTLSGEVGVAAGSLNVQPSQIGTEEDQAPTTETVAQLADKRWTFEAPLVLYGPDVESPASDQLRALIPSLRFINFQGLRLTLGPDLRVVVPGLANFQTDGTLRLDGALDPNLQVRGLVRLRQGRLGLFTTTFNLDPGAANVAVFTPGLGLIPYLDITLRTRVSDSLAAGGVYSGSGTGSPYAPTLSEVETQGSFSSLDQLNLVRVFLTVSGPADRLADNITLRSTPPLPEDRLLALIGGNSLAGVVGSGAGAALATVLGQSLLSPVLGTLGDAFGQRLSIALYPAYVNQAVTRGSEQRSGRVPPQLVVATELGLDITERFNASVLAAPNVDNVPPQLNLTFKASELLNIQGSVDAEGAWQTQLQVFFRF